MKPNIFCCPYCHGDLVFEDGYRCDNCSLVFPYKHDIYYFFNPDTPHWQKVMDIERYNLKTYSKPSVDMDELEKTKVYEVYHEYQGEPHKSAQLYLPAQANAALLNYAFDIMQKPLKEEDDSCIITIGARSFWDSYFLARYKPVIAVDVVDDTRYINPDYAKGITRVVADGMYLPLKEGIASIIYMNATFHHMEDKERALRTWYRVLKPSGMVVATGEYRSPPEQKGSRDFEGEYSYTLDDFIKLVDGSQFSAGALFPFSYCENMEYKMGIELTGNPDNGIIVLIKKDVE